MLAKRDEQNATRSAGNSKRVPWKHGELFLCRAFSSCYCHWTLLLRCSFLLSLPLPSPPSPFSFLVTFLPPWRCFTGSLPSTDRFVPSSPHPAHTFLGIFCFRRFNVSCLPPPLITEFEILIFLLISSSSSFFLFCAKKKITFEEWFWYKTKMVLFYAILRKVTMFVDWFWYELKVAPGIWWVFWNRFLFGLINSRLVDW